MKKVSFLILGLALIGLSGCTTTAESQLKQSVCQDCFGKEEFFRNGMLIEEVSRG